MTVGQMIRNARHNKRLTQRDVAERTGINFTYLSKIENEKAGLPASERTYRAIASALDLDADKLIAASDRWTKIKASELAELDDIITRLLDGANRQPGRDDRTIIYRQDFEDLSAWWLRRQGFEN